MRMRFTALTVVLSTLALSVAHAGTMSLQDAQKKARSQDKPILLKIGTQWCAACQKFDSAVAENDAFRSDLAEDVILVQLDAEADREGQWAAARYDVNGGYPTFVLTNADGEAMDRWMGYRSPDKFSSMVDEVVMDAMPVTERIDRFRAEPTAKDAARIAEYRLSEGLAGEAVAYYRQAMQLDRGHAGYAYGHFSAVVKAMGNKLCKPEDVLGAADAVYARAGAESTEMFGVLWKLRDMATATDNVDVYVPYLATAITRTEGAENADVERYRDWYMADYILYVDGDVERAVQTKKASLPEGWKNMPNQLNNYAWWLYENNIYLDEAYQVAERGIQLAEPGSMKANIYDTLAEICNRKGDCEEAVTLIQLAISEDPNNPYFARQAERFETALRGQLITK